jgi:hypothetical protein
MICDCGQPIEPDHRDGNTVVYWCAHCGRQSTVIDDGECVLTRVPILTLLAESPTQGASHESA